MNIEQFVNNEVIYNVSSLIYGLAQENKLDEEVLYNLHQGPIDWQAAKYEIELCKEVIFQHCSEEDNNIYYGIKTQDSVQKIDPIYDTEEAAIAEWFTIYHGDDLEDYRQEVYEHWICSERLISKLEQEGEIVVRDFYGLDIWCRTSTGQSIKVDYVIQKIFSNLI